MIVAPQALAAELIKAESIVESLSRKNIPPKLQRSIIFAAQRSIQVAGILLRLPQDVIAQAIVLFTRFWIVSEDGSGLQDDALDFSAAALFLAAKSSAMPSSPKSVVNVYAFLACFPLWTGDHDYTSRCDPELYFLSDGEFQRRRDHLAENEMALLQTIGFNTSVSLPYNFCMSYLQALDAFISADAGQRLAKRALAHLNAALLSPQYLYLTHPANALAVAAIYIAAREVDVKLPEMEWWKVFDVEREDLGFLVVGLLSMEGFVDREVRIWKGSKKMSIV